MHGVRDIVGFLARWMAFGLRWMSLGLVAGRRAMVDQSPVAGVA
jgi:hypothetical protein